MTDKKRKITNYFVSKNAKKRRKEDKTQSITGFAIIPNFCFKSTVTNGLNVDYAMIFDKTEADNLYDLLENEVQYNLKSQVKIFGKTFDVPRRQTAYGDNGLTYTFSGVTVAARHWTTLLLRLKMTVETICKEEFNFVLVNRYNDGNDCIGEHQDDEKDLELQAPIVSLSFGQNRDFVFKHKTSRGCKNKPIIPNIKFNLEHGSMLVMRSPTNTNWYHSLPKRSVKTHPNPRINLTFRKMRKFINIE